MRITQVIHGVHNTSAGSHYSVTQLAHSLAAHGHACEVLSPGPAPARWDGTARLTLYDTPFVRNTGLAFGLIGECRRRAGQRVILHNHGVWRLTNLFPLAVPKDARARIVCSPRGTFASWCMNHKSTRKVPFWTLLQRPALERVHCFHATAEPEAEDIRRLGFRQPIAIIPNGVDVPSLPATERQNNLVFLGRIAQEKGIDMLLKAWRELAAEFPHWRLRIAGPLTSAHAADMQALARSLELPRCEFIGELRGAAKTAELAAARLFVLPSHTENFGVVVAEALAHGVPVVTTTGTPWSELEDRRCGWRVPPERAALTIGLRKALSHAPSELASMGAAGREWVSTVYRWDAVTDRMVRTYEWLLSDERGTAPDWVDTGR
jgi:glycosyltransferase involved in cell wall biosynthesis